VSSKSLMLRRMGTRKHVDPRSIRNVMQTFARCARRAASSMRAVVILNLPISSLSHCWYWPMSLQYVVTSLSPITPRAALDAKKVIGAYFLNNHCALQPIPPHHRIQASSGLSESGPKNADVPKSPFPDSGSPGAVGRHNNTPIELRSDAEPQASLVSRPL
jgi:hypothetical protein